MPSTASPTGGREERKSSRERRGGHEEKKVDELVETRIEHAKKRKRDKLETREKKNRDKRARWDARLCKIADDTMERWTHVGSKFRTIA